MKRFWIVLIPVILIGCEGPSGFECSKADELVKAYKACVGEPSCMLTGVDYRQLIGAERMLVRCVEYRWEGG